ncbi:MAG: carboxypeptidase-like regulatory domain-containing protein [Acidimicrobiales bacterium]
MRRTAALAVVLALATGCTGDEDGGPTPTTDPTVPTSVVDYSGVMLAGVPGETTSTIVEAGTATLSGSVQGPGGLIPGATVRIERLVADREVRTDVLTGADGRFILGGVPGGRYRVRAFLAPSLIQLEPEVRFLADDEEHTFDLAVEQVGGLVVRADVAPDTPIVDEPVNLVASVMTRTVGADGILRSTPVAGTTVELVGLGRWRLRSPSEDDPPDDDPSPSTSVTFGTTTSTTSRQSAPSPVARTDGRGMVRYELRCQASGDPGLALRIPVTITPPPDPSGASAAPQQGTETVTLQLPACVDSTTETTAGTAPSSSGSTSTSTSTTEP